MGEPSRHGEDAARVGVRELRQNLSIYLDRVKAGETLEVTERGHPVAELRPLADEADVIDRLVSDGRAWPAEAPIEELPEPFGEPSEEMSRRIREALDAESEDVI